MSVTDKIKLENENQCSLCHNEYSPKILEFHHLDRKEKLAAVSQLIYEDDIRNEAAKCIIVCSNCHNGIHRNLYKHIDFSNVPRACKPYSGPVIDKAIQTKITKIKKAPKMADKPNVVKAGRKECNNNKAQFTLGCAVDIFNKRINTLQFENQELQRLVICLLSLLPRQ